MKISDLVITIILFQCLIIVTCKKTVIITGANRGVGLATTKILAVSNEWNIIAACRSTAAAESAFRPLQGKDNVIIKQLDLADLRSVNSFIKDIKKANMPIDCLACNAGVQFSGSGTNPFRTIQGYEKTVGINHIGHFALATQLIDVLEKSDYARLVFVGSGVHNPEEAGGQVGSKATLGDMKGLAEGFRDPYSMIDGGAYDGDKAYKDSKLCNVATSLEFARRLQAVGSKVTCNVMNPGLIPTTGLFRDLNPIFVAIFTLLTRYVFKVAVSEDVGGERLAYMISNPMLNKVTGAYYSGDPFTAEFKLYEVSKEARNPTTGKKLWELTEKLIKTI